MADGEVSLDFLINDEASGSVDKIVDHAVKGANTIDTSTSKSASKVREEAEKTRAELDKKFGKETRVKLTTQFDKAGVKNFDEILEKLPKEKQIELLTKTNKGELIDVEKEIKALPPTVKSEIKFKDNASPEIKKLAALSKKDIRQKLVADADTHGIKNFDALLKKLPKKTQTQLLAKAEKGEVINYEKTLRKLPSKVITNVQLNDNASPNLHKLQNDAEKTQQKFNSFKQTMAGTFAGNAFFQGAQMVTAGIGGIMQELNESSKAWQTFEGNMHEFGKTDEEIKKVKGELQTFAQQSIYSASDMASTYSQLAAVGTKNTTELVKGFGGLSAAAEDPKQAMKTLSQQATQMAAKPKVAWEDFKLILEQSPAGMSAVAKQMGMSVGELTTKVQDGKVKTQDMFDAISKAGNSKSFSKMATNYKTVGEAVDGLKEGITNKLQPAFDGMSKVGIKAISGIANKFDNMNLNPVINMFKNFGKIAKPIIQGMVEPFRDMGKAIGGVAKHTGGLSGFNKVLGDIGKHQGALKVIGTLLGSVLTGIMAFKAITGVATAIKSVTTAFKLLKLAMISNPFGLVVVAVVAIGTALYELYKHNTKFKKFIDGIGKGIKQLFKSAGKTISNGIKSIKKAFKGVVNFFKKDWKEILLLIVNPFSGAFALLYKHNAKFKKGVDGAIKWIKTTLSKFGKWFNHSLNSFGKWLSKAWKSIWNPISDVFEDIFNFFIKIWNTWYKNFTHNLSSLGKWLSKTWKNIWNPIKNFFSDIWDDIKNIGKKAWNWISDRLSGFGNSIKKTWNHLWSSVSDSFGDTWNGIKNTGKRAWNWITDKMDGFGSNISKGWHSLWRGLGNFFGDIWDDIKHTASKGMNAVIGFINKGIGGINGVIHTFGGSQHAIHEVPKFAKGTKGAPTGLAMVNDGNGEELIIDNQGAPHVLEGRNRLVAFSGGETVIPHEDTKALFGGVVPHFAKGTPNWLEGVTDWVKDKWDSLKNFIKHPLKAIGGIMNNAIKGVTSNTPEFVKEFTPPVGRQFVNSIIKPITALFKKLNSKHDEDMGDAGGNHGNPSGAGVQRWRGLVKKALEANGLSTSTSIIEKVLRQIATESGGNPKVTQGGADPDGDGSGPAMGLMQTKRATFLANAFPGHHDIFNGYDSLLAGLHYAKGRYGADLSFLGNGHGYANGGWADKPSIFGEIKGQPEIAINPYRDTADQHIIEAIDKRAQIAPNSPTAKLQSYAHAIKSSMTSQPQTANYGHVQQSHNAQSGQGQLISLDDLKNAEINIVTNLEGETIASATVDLISALQSRKVQIDAYTSGQGGIING